MPDPSSAEKQSPFARLEGFLLRIGKLWGAVVVVGSAIYSYTHYVAPVPPIRRVSMSDVRVDRSTLGHRNLIVTFKVQIDGYDGSYLPVSYTLVDTETGRRETGQSTLGINAIKSSRRGNPTSGFEVVAHSDWFSGTLAMEVPSGPTNWKVVIEITGPKKSPDTVLDRAETEPFQVRAPQSQ